MVSCVTSFSTTKSKNVNTPGYDTVALEPGKGLLHHVLGQMVLPIAGSRDEVGVLDEGGSHCEVSPAMNP